MLNAVETGGRYDFPWFALHAAVGRPPDECGRYRRWRPAGCRPTATTEPRAERPTVRWGSASAKEPLRGFFAVSGIGIKEAVDLALDLEASAA